MARHGSKNSPLHGLRIPNAILNTAGLRILNSAAGLRVLDAAARPLAVGPARGALIADAAGQGIEVQLPGPRQALPGARAGGVCRHRVTSSAEPVTGTPGLADPSSTTVADSTD